MKKAFDHIGLWTDQSQPGEFWVPHSEVWVTNPRTHPLRVEFLRPKTRPSVSPDQIGLWRLWHGPHVAYRVDNLADALRGERLILGPFDPGGFGQVAFILKEGLILEFMEYTDLTHWFGQPNPTGFKVEEFWDWK